jgi:protein TonB
MTRPDPPRFTAFGVSVVFHAGLAMLLLVYAGMQPEQVSTKAVPIRTDLVFMQQIGPGGGGGSRLAPAPPQRTEIPVHQKPTLAIEASAVPVDPAPTLDVPVQPNSSVLRANGMTLGAAPAAGGGNPGTGAGPGQGGPGVGPGKDGGIGGGPRGPGAVTDPRPFREVKPAYTSGALAAKIQGSVTLEVEVLANGTVGNVKVLRSLDRVYGLDLEAIKAARQWLFIPGTHAGKPVDVIVQIILDFNLR